MERFKFAAIENFDHASTVIRSLRSKHSAEIQRMHGNSDSLFDRRATKQTLGKEERLESTIGINDFNRIVVQAKEESEARLRMAATIDASIENFNGLRTGSHPTKNVDEDDIASSDDEAEPKSNVQVVSRDKTSQIASPKRFIATSYAQKSPKKGSSRSSSVGRSYASDNSWSDEDESAASVLENKELFAGFVAPKPLSSSSSSNFGGENVRKVIQGTKDLLNNSSNNHINSSSNNNESNHGRVVARPGQRLFVRANTGPRKR